MKKVVQPNVRKVYGATNQQQESQMNAVRKIHNLLSSGAVTVTGPTQPRILKQKVASVPNATINQGGQIQLQQPQLNATRCYICDDLAGNQSSVLAESATTHSNTKLPNKLGQILGEAFMVIISVEDVICKRCMTMLNQVDRLEMDLDRVRTNLLSYLYKKYNLSDDDRQSAVPSSPPVKMQKLNSGNVITRKVIADDDQDNVTRKITVQNRDPIDNQLSNLFESGEKQMSSGVGQTKIITQGGAGQQQIARKGPIKIYKCMSCDFKTTDLKQFQPHYETCKQQNGYQCKTCKKIFSNMQALKQHIAEKHPTDYTCNTCSTTFINEITLKKHIELNHPEMRMTENISQLYSCTMCQYKTTDKGNYDDHLKKHIKVKPFKCRLCSNRFETREQASIHAKSHQPNYFKCGTCSASFTQREMLVEHFKTHQNKVQQTQQTQQPAHVLTTQKLLQDTIDEALRESSENLDTKGIHFFSCNICSLTFIQENYYNQHMETHKRENKKPGMVNTASSQSLIRQEVRNTNTTTLTTTTQANSISEADIESIFERMHSDKSEGEAVSNNTNENLVITSQENAVGGITFNITIPQQENNEPISKGNGQEQQSDHSVPPTTADGISVGIDMPVLDQPEDVSPQNQARQVEKVAGTEEEQHQSQSQQQQPAAPVSMPSLDDEGDSQSQPSNTDQVPMDLEDMQNSVEGNQIKFILNENGQILQLDNHIITTDADGNQILVQGTDSEQIQQLLQSVGVLHTGDSLDGETLQMIGDNNQMIIVQQGDNEAQLIDASLLNADGHIVIQQAQDGDLQEGAHAIGEDGVRIPVSVAFTDQQSEHVGIHTEQSQDQTENQDQTAHQKDSTSESGRDESTGQGNITPVTSGQSAVTTTQSLPTSTGEPFFALEELMQQPEQKND